MATYDTTTPLDICICGSCGHEGHVYDRLTPHQALCPTCGATYYPEELAFLDMDPQGELDLCESAPEGRLLEPGLWQMRSEALANLSTPDAPRLDEAIKSAQACAWLACMGYRRGTCTKGDVKANLRVLDDLLALTFSRILGEWRREVEGLMAAEDGQGASGAWP